MEKQRRPLTNSGREELRQLLATRDRLLQLPTMTADERRELQRANIELNRFGTRSEAAALAEAPTQEELMEKTGNDYSMHAAKIEPQRVTGGAPPLTTEEQMEQFVYGTRLRHGTVSAPSLEVGSIGEALPSHELVAEVRAHAIREAVAWLVMYHGVYKPEHLARHMIDDLLGRKS